MVYAETRKVIHWLAGGCLFLALLLAMVAIWVWVAGVGDLLVTAWGPAAMSPVTAVIVGGAAVLIGLRWRMMARTGCFWLGLGVAGLAVVGGFRVFLGSWDAGWLRGSAISAGSGRLGEVGDGRWGGVSGMIGLGLVMVGVGLALTVVANRGGGRWRAWAKRTYQLLAGLGTAGLVWEWMGGDLARSGGCLPLLGLILVGLGGWGREAAGMRGGWGGWLTVRQTGPVLLSSGLAVLIAGMGAWQLRGEQAQRRAAARKELEGIAEAKANQVANWRKERLSDARFFAGAGFVSRTVRQMVERPFDLAPYAEVRNWMGLLKAGTRYERVILYDAELRPLLSLPDEIWTPSEGLREWLRSALDSHGIRMSDPYRDPVSDEVRIDLAFSPASGTDAELGSEDRVAPLRVVFLLRLDPAQFLYPLVRSWPAPSETGEVLLAKREGGGVAWLSDPRGGAGTALREVQFPRPGERSILWMVAEGREGHYEGVEPGGERVLAVVRRVPDSEWQVVARVAGREILEPLRRQAWMTLGLILALSAGVVPAVGWLWQHRALEAERERLVLSRRVAWLTTQAKEALSASEERFRRAVNDAPFPAVFHAEDGEILVVNRMWTQITGYELEDMPTVARWTELAYGERRQAVREGIVTLFDLTECRREGEFEIRTRTGEARIWDFSTTPLGRLPDGRRLVLSMAVDVTERKKAEVERERYESEMRQQQKLEALGTLASGVAHEINNPINGVMNYAELILDSVPAGSLVSDYAREIVGETHRVAGIVRDLLRFARRESQGHHPVRLKDIVDATLSLVRAAMRHDQIRLEAEVPADLPLIHCRSQQIQQVLMNLLTNARDALNEKYAGWHERKRIRIAGSTVRREGREWVRLTVEDFGMGIAPEIRERIFDPFFTTKPRDKGTGLGLSISHGMVKEHQGELHLETEPGQWTRFHVDLPVPGGGAADLRSTSHASDTDRR